jgi:NAD(P)H-dependent flavin oxidoreductase YrpB (nitropropane dioxygenase family)
VSKIKPLILGDLKIEKPIIQGGMGVRVSTSALASAVANCGAAGTIASVGLAPDTPEHRVDVPKSSREHFIKEIRTARKKTNGVIGVNIMVALSNFEDLARTSASEGVDYIISGAGLPISLPEYTEGSVTKLIPLISSARGLQVILKTWKRRYNRLPDAVVVEGPLSGGHIGNHTLEELNTGKFKSLEDSLKEVVGLVKEYELLYNKKIPVIAAGGIFDGKDMAKFIAMGAGGVQIGTRFILTEECSAAQAYKELFITSTKEDLVFIQSPVGMPAKVIRTKFVDDMEAGGRRPISCVYQCLRTCNPSKVPYCIARVLIDAVEGDVDNGLVFASSYIDRVDKIVTCKELINELMSDAEAALA